MLQCTRYYVIVDTEEMTYVEGGASYTISGTTSQIRTRLDSIIALCVAGGVLVAALGAYIGGVAGAIVGALAGAAWFGAILGYARTAHGQVEALIKQYGTSKACKMTSTWSTLFCTGISVTL